jgi:hypothetical protein
VRVDPHHPLNERIVEYFRAQAPYARPITPKGEAGDPYSEAGAHPEIVERMWDIIGAQLAPGSQCLLYGVPVLVQPDSGIVLAVAMGTGYFVRVPDHEVAFALAEGYQTTWNVSPSSVDATKSFGPGWVLGRFEDREARWCRMADEQFASAAASHAMLTADTPAKTPHHRGTLVLVVRESPDFAPREIATNPDGDGVEHTIRSLEWNAMTFVSLERGADAITASGSLDPGDGLSISYVENDEEHISASPPESIDQIVSIMRSYATGDRSWRTMIDWD